MTAYEQRRFDRWVQRCAMIAMQTEWVIDASWDGWLRCYKEGYTPQKAVGYLFQKVRENEEV